MTETRSLVRSHTKRVSLSRRETRLRTLLERVAAANNRGESPNKATIVGGVPSQTRAGHYRLVDELIRRHLLDPGPGTAYTLTVTDAGHQVLAGETAVATWETTEEGVIVWVLCEHVAGGARFYWACDTEDEAVSKADPGDHTVAYTLTETWRRMRNNPSGEVVLGERTLFQRS